MRAFIGIGLPEHVRASLAAIQAELGGSGADVKWVAAALLHVTLKFLDEITDAQRQSVEALLHRVAGSEQAVTLGIAGVGAFPSVSAPRIVWVGLSEGGDRLARIVAMIEAEGRSLGLRREERPFTPHLTLGRVRSSMNLAALTQRLQAIEWVPPQAWLVSSLTLYQSVLSASGPAYTVLGEFLLTT